MKKQINRNKKGFKPNWKRIAIAVTVAFFFVLGVYTAAVSAYDAAVDGVTLVKERLAEQEKEHQQSLVVKYDYHEQVVAHCEGHLVGFIMGQGFSYQEALILANEAKESNGLSSFKVEKGTILWLPARENR